MDDWLDVPGLDPRLNALYRQSWALLNELSDPNLPADLFNDLWVDMDAVDSRIANVRAGGDVPVVVEDLWRKLGHA